MVNIVSNMPRLLQNHQIEKRLLSSLLLKEGEAIEETARILDVEDFYRPEHRIIYAAIMRLYKRVGSVDFDLVRDELFDTKEIYKVSLSYYNALEGMEYTTARAGYYAELVHEKACMRKLIEVGREIADEANRSEETEKRLVEVLSFAEKRLMSVTARERRVGMSGLSEVLSESFEQIRQKQGGVNPGVPSGFADLDKVLCGFQASDLILLAARPSVGKTALALNMAVNAAVRGKTVAVFSLEMSRVQLGSRILSSWSGINSQYLNSGNLSAQDLGLLTQAAGELSKLKMYMDDTAGIGLLEMRAAARRVQHDFGLDMIIIDYLQLMQGGRAENRQQEISEISRGLKGMARELKVPVMALSQLSRSVEMRAEKKPQLSDLRESGSLEQDADVVMFLYRDEYYNRDDPTNENIAEVIIAKNRNGPTTAVRLHFDKAIMKFGNLTREVN